jgi:phosphonate transport system substrate-binding protein
VSWTRGRGLSWALCLALVACFQHPPDQLPAPNPTADKPYEFKPPPGLEKLRLGLVPHLSPDRMRTTRAPLVAYLSGSLGVPVEMVIGADYDDVGEQLARGELDLAEFSPYSYVRARRKAKLTPLVSAISAGSSTSGGYIIVREDSPRRSIDELKGARFGFVDPASTSGYLYPLKLFRDRGIDPATYFASTAFLGSHDGVLLAILDGGIEAGATWQGSFGALKSKSGVDPLSFRVIAKMPRTPQDVMCVRSELPPEVGAAVKALMLRLSMRQKADRDILSSMSVNGYVDADLEAYAQVERIANELDAGGQ